MAAIYHAAITVVLFHLMSSFSVTSNKVLLLLNGARRNLYEEPFWSDVIFSIVIFIIIKIAKNIWTNVSRVVLGIVLEGVCTAW